MKAISKMTHEELKLEATRVVLHERKLRKMPNSQAECAKYLRRAWSVMKRLPAGTRVDLTVALGSRENRGRSL